MDPAKNRGWAPWEAHLRLEDDKVRAGDAVGEHGFALAVDAPLTLRDLVLVEPPRRHALAEQPEEADAVRDLLKRRAPAVRCLRPRLLLRLHAAALCIWSSSSTVHHSTTVPHERYSMEMDVCSGGHMIRRGQRIGRPCADGFDNLHR